MEFFKKTLRLQQPPGPLNKSIHPSAESDPTVLEWLNEIFPTGRQLLQYIRSLFPFLGWIRHYNLQWFVGDLIAGKYSRSLFVYSTA